MKNFNIGTRLGVGFGAVLVIFATLTAMAIWRMQTASELTDALVNVKVKNERLVTEWDKIIVVNTARTLAAFRVSEAPAQKEFEQLIADSSVRAVEIQKQLEGSIKDAHAKELFVQSLDKRQAYQDSRREVFKLKATGNVEAAQKLYDSDTTPKVKAYLLSVDELSQYQKRLLDAVATDINQRYQNGRVMLISIGVMAILLGVGFAIWITRSITIPIKDAVRVAKTVAAGDLTSEIMSKTKDETGMLLSALKAMNDSLVQIVGQVRTGTDTIARASSEISSGNMDLSSRTEQQASSLEETASSMEELTATVKQNADNAHQANQLAVTASEIAVRGGTVVAEVVDTMDSISDSSKKIVDIISVIDGIAFQTNILALNAAVEAARAGEQGRGFAVVATEVRSLAQRSAAAAKEIKTLINDSVEKVDSGSKLVARAGSTMEEIVDSVRRVTDIMAEISAASNEQSAGIEQINQAIGQMDQVTQQNAALVEEAAAAASSLQDQSSQLAGVVGVFKLDNNDGAVTAQSKAMRTSSSGPVGKPSSKPLLTRGRSNTTIRGIGAKHGKMPAEATNVNEWQEF